MSENANIDNLNSNNDFDVSEFFAQSFGDSSFDNLLESNLYMSRLKLLEDRLETEEEKEVKKDSKNMLWVLVKNNFCSTLVGFFYAIMILRMCLFGYLLYDGIRKVDKPFSTNYSFVLFWIFFPFIIWLFSTTRWCKFWGYTKKRIFGYVLCVVHAAFTCLPLVYTFSFNTFVPLALKIPVSRDITPNMILNLGRGIVLFVTLLATFLICFVFLRSLKEEETYENLSNIKIDKFWDLRKNKKTLYDCHFMRRNDTGAIVNIPMESRFIHSSYIGASGSGKTSMLLSRSIVDDLQVKAKNMDKLASMAVKLTKKGIIAPKEPFENDEFAPTKFKILVEEKADEWKAAVDKYINCGITAIAPNASFADEIYEYAKRKGFKVNRVDPTLTEEDKHKAGYIGYNPLYISPGKTEFRKDQEIIKKARNFADVMSALNEMKGQGDPYFTSLNNLLTNFISMLVMKAYPLMNAGKQPNLRHVQEVFNDFNKAKQYYDVLSAQDAEVTARYQVVLDFVKTKLLDEKARQKIAEHATGLTVLINNFLGNELIANVLCAEKSLDMDKCLEEGQITVVNFALELSREDASVFGNFFILNFISAVFRRSKKGRIPHFLFIDEWPVLVNNHHRQMFDLFRQYRVGVAVALQSLDQIDTPNLQGMKSAVLSTGLAVVYGRTSENEMKTFNTLAGTKWGQVEQKSVTEKSITDENTDLSYSTRTSKQKVDFLGGSELRYQDFQNAYVFMVDRGTPVPPFQVKTDFLNEFEIRTLKRYKYDWRQLYEDYGIASSGVKLSGNDNLDASDGVSEASLPEIKNNGSVSTTKVVSMPAIDFLENNGSVSTPSNDKSNGATASFLQQIEDAGEPNQDPPET